MNQDKLTFLSEKEASSISGGGIGCWISTGAAIASFSLHCFNFYALSTIGMVFYCE